MWVGIVLSGLGLSVVMAYLLYRAYREADEDFHPESHAHRGSL
jgi:hypothetical protein